MSKILVSVTALFGLAFVFSITVRGQEAPAPSTVWDKVYTDSQAARGKDAYMTECSACHSEDLGGSGYAPGRNGEAPAEALQVEDLALPGGVQTVQPR